MVAVVYTDNVGSGPDWLAAKPNKQIFDYLASAGNQAMSTVTAAAQEFIQSAGQVYQAITYSDAMRKARAVLREVANTGTLNVVQELTTMGQLQHASPTMQRWIMADPLVRTPYHAGQLDGYSGTYVDHAPNVSGVDHYDYRRVMDGMWHTDEAGQTAMSLFYEDTGDDEPLDALDQMAIMRTWDHVRASLRRGKEDPTSRHNEML